MNRDDIRKLIGGYATGTLTEAERKLLFDAALDDQELFDELAGEQDLKELLETPGVRNRLASALEPSADQIPKPRPWWVNAWILGNVLAIAAGITAAVLMLRPAPPVEVAQVQQPAVGLPGATSDGPRPAAPPAPVTAPSPAPTPSPALKQESDKRREPESKAAAPPPELDAAARQNKDEAPPAPAAEAITVQESPKTLTAAVAQPQQPVQQAANRPPDAPKTAFAQQQAQTEEPRPLLKSETQAAPAPPNQTQQTERRDQVAGAGGVAPGVVGGVVGGTVGALRSAVPALAKAPAVTRTAFTFTAIANGVRITPAVDGFVQVAGSDAQAVRRGVAVELPFPTGAAPTLVTFSIRQPSTQVKDAKAQPKDAKRESTQPVQGLSGASGTVPFPADSPDSVTVQIAVR